MAIAALLGCGLRVMPNKSARTRRGVLSFRHPVDWSLLLESISQIPISATARNPFDCFASESFHLTIGL
jgi:hypothetical protein